MVKDEFVTYDQAVILKELGFTGLCLYNYDAAGNFVPNSEVACGNEGITTDDLLESHNVSGDGRTDAPTLHQIQKWLREEEKLWVTSDKVKQKALKEKYYWIIYDEDLVESCPLVELSDTYEGALSNGISACLYCLKLAKQNGTILD